MSALRCAATSLALAAANLFTTTAAAQDIRLESGEAVSFALPAAAFAHGFYIDVEEPDTALTIDLEAVGHPEIDIDLLLRRATPFQFNAQQPADADALFDQAQYRSASSTGVETLTVLKQGRLPLRAGRWYVAALNFVNVEVDVELRATLSQAAEPPYEPISVDFSADVTQNEDSCNVAPWYDSTPRAPAGGNNGTTLGQQRRNALLEAARLLSEELRPTVPIRLRACWDDLGSGTSLTLAQASSTYIFLDDTGVGSHMPFLDDRFSYFSTPASARQAGTSTCRFAGGPCNVADVRAEFNTTVDTDDGLGSRGFYYGFDRNHGNDVDFISVGMHEITHGLGFYGLVSAGPTDDDPDGLALGERFTDYGDAYGNHVRFVTTAEDIGTPLLDLDVEQRAAALTSGGGLRFAGPHAVASERNPTQGATPPASFPRLYAPLTPTPGSTLSHFGTSLFGELMVPFASSDAPHTLGLARDVLFDVGWDPAAVEAVDAFPRPVSGIYFDPARSGHGINLLRIPGLDDFYFLVFYTFDTAGKPEYYISSGPIVDGVYVPARGANGDTLARPVYVHGAEHPNQLDNSPGFNGQIRLDFNEAAKSPACRDGHPGRSADDSQAVMTWTINNESAQWCLQPIAAPATQGPDYSNLWGNGQDTGWGLFTFSYGIGDDDAISLIIYYPDGNGHGRWAIQQLSPFTSGDQGDLLQVQGYCRLCTRPDGALPHSVVGEIAPTLTDPSLPSASPDFAPGHLAVRADFDGDASLRFERDISIVPLAEWGPIVEPAGD